MELSILGLYKQYDKKVALSNIQTTLTPGIYGLLGPNGAGKSTLMNILSHNLLPSEGAILYDGNDIWSLGKAYRALLGYMPQQQGLYDGFTALQFLSYIASLKAMGKKKANEDISNLLHKLGLYDVRHKKLRTFSGGMKQRVLIAQAILGNPEILIFDEPTAGLDPKQRIIIRNLISEISMHKIVLIATHVVSDIEYIAKEIILLKDGVIIDQGSVPQLTDLVADKVFEIATRESQLDSIKQQYKIVNVSKEADYLQVRALCEQTPDGFSYQAAKPGLEDVYLYCFDDELVF